MKARGTACRLWSVEIKRVVIFGHLPKSMWSPRVGRYSHTHSYIHKGYFRAFRALGYDTLWLDNKHPRLADIPVDGTLFFTEGQVELNIPISSSAGYITHSSKTTLYEERGANRLNLWNYVSDLRGGTSFGYPGSSVTKINDVTYLDESFRALYQPWATNLLPEEIDLKRFMTFDGSIRKINYVGTVGHDNIKLRLDDIKKQAKKRKIAFRVLAGVSDEEAVEAARTSLVNFDIRGDWHLERGYVPCRIFKTLSYGKHLTSNSPLLAGVFGDRIAIEPELENFLDRAIQSSSEATSDHLIDNMMWVRDHHTFINRADQCIDAFDKLFP